MNEEAKNALLLKYKDVLDKFENINSELGLEVILF